MKVIWCTLNTTLFLNMNMTGRPWPRPSVSSSFAWKRSRKEEINRVIHVRVCYFISDARIIYRRSHNAIDYIRVNDRFFFLYFFFKSAAEWPNPNLHCKRCRCGNPKSTFHVFLFLLKKWSYREKINLHSIIITSSE